MLMYEEGFRWWRLGLASSVAFVLFLLTLAGTLVQVAVTSKDATLESGGYRIFLADGLVAVPEAGRLQPNPVAGTVRAPLVHASVAARLIASRSSVRAASHP